MKKDEEDKEKDIPDKIGIIHCRIRLQPNRKNIFKPPSSRKTQNIHLEYEYWKEDDFFVVCITNELIKLSVHKEITPDKKELHFNSEDDSCKTIIIRLEKDVDVENYELEELNGISTYSFSFL